MNRHNRQPAGSDAYRALHPPLFSPKSDDPQGPTRQWRTLRLPFIRVLGPLWSFGLRVGELSDEATLPGMDPHSTEVVSRALRAIYTLQTPRAHGPLAQFHAPTLLRAEVQAFLQRRTQQKGKRKTADPPPPDSEPPETRSSLLALATIPDDDHLALSRECLPVSDGDVPVGGALNIIVSPFGTWPPPLAGPVPNGDHCSTTQLLPAMQLMHGKIRFRPDARYLATARARMGLLPPEAADEVEAGDTVVLLPDGFCVAGRVVLPWTEQPAAGWFKATFRRLEAGGAVQRVLKPWLDPLEPGHGSLIAAWREHLAALDRLLRGPGDGAAGAGEAPRWLHVAPGVALEPAHLFWPETGPADSPLFSRDGAAGQPALSIDSEGLLMRLADRPLTAGPLSVLTLQPDHFDLRRQPGAVLIEGVAGDELPPPAPPGQAGVEARYAFQRGAPAQANSETLSFAYRHDGGRPDSPEALAVRLALPLIETAEAVRQATGLPRPGPTAPLDLLWTFTPMQGGWLHWPLPNATAASLARLIPDNSGDIPPGERSREIQGALTFGNVALQADYLPTERAWSLGLAGARRAPFTLRLDLDAQRYGAVLAAAVTLQDFEMSFEGFATITPFRQRAEQLLPESADRALLSLPLKAVSPNLLRGIEAQMWRQAEMPGTRPQVRVEVLLHGLRLEAVRGRAATQVAAGASLAWITRFSGQAAGGPALDAKTQRPWVWAAHAALPTVQTLPLAAAGRQRNTPALARALAPLQTDALPEGAEIGYVAALDMGRVEAALSVRVRNAGGTFRAAKFVRPTAGEAWRDEIGMAVTTLPSATYFVGIAPRPGDIAWGTQWGIWSTRVAAELRHDIALRDEHHAFARAPGPAVASDPAAGAAAPPPPPQPLFAPLANNGPEAGARRNGWDVVWRGLQRRAALAAVDRRAMLERDSAGPPRLVGVFGETDYPFESASLDERTQLVVAGSPDLDPAIGPQIKAIGSFTIDFLGDAVRPARMECDGLPAERDLIGLTGTFRRSGADVAVTYGTAALARAGDGSFTDQHGLRLLAPAAGPRVLVKTLAGRAGAGHSVRLLSLVEPIVCAGAVPLHFWCADVPVADAAGVGNPLEWFAASATDLGLRANAAGLDLNHLAGFRWWLGSPQVPPHLGVAIIEGLVFEPLELLRVVQAAAELPSQVVIGGRLRLPVGDPEQSTVPGSEASATLTLVRTALGHVASLQAEDMAWPLVDPHGVQGPAPTLLIKSLPAPGAKSAASLRYRFGDADVTADLDIERDSEGRIRATLNAPAAPATESVGEGSIDFESLSLDLAGAAVSGGRIAPRVTHRVTVAHRLRLGPAGAQVEGLCTFDVLGGRVALSALHHAFSDLDRIEIQPHPAEQERSVAFGPQHFALCWQAPQGGQRDPLWGALTVTEAQGALVAALAQRPRTGSDAGAPMVPSYRVADLDARAGFALRAGGSDSAVGPGATGPRGTLALALDWLRGARAHRTYRLSGELTLDNAFSWPELEPAQKTGDWMSAELDAEWSRGFGHRAVLRFDGQHIRPQAIFERREVALAAEVEHVVSRLGPPIRHSRAATRGPTLGSISWRIFQVVRLLSLAGLRRRLDQVATPAAGSNLLRAHTGVSPLLSPNALPLIEQQALPHILHAGAVDPGALSGRLAVLLRRRLADVDYDERLAPLTVDVSHHALLGGDSALSGAAKLAAPLVLVGLPAIGFVDAPQAAPLLPANETHPLRRAFAARLAAAATLYLAWADRYDAHLFPALDPALATQALRRIVDARAALDPAADCVACAAIGFDAAGDDADKTPDPQQPVFQAVVFRDSGARRKPVLAVDKLPAAGTAFQLSALFGRMADARPLALSFGVRSPLTLADFYKNDDGKVVEPPAGPVVFDPQVYRRALAAFRDALGRQVVPGPDALPLAASASATAPAGHRTMRLEAIARDGGVVVSVGSLEVEEASPGNPEAWAARTLARNAPWATVGLLTVRSAGFGFEPGSAAQLVVRKEAGVLRPRLEPTRLVQLRSRQPQCESLTGGPWGAAAPGLAAGYVPLQVSPALVRSEGGPLPSGSTDGPRLAATAATTSWALAGGAGALLEARATMAASGPLDDFWLCERENLALREAHHAPAARPFDVTFALPPGYQVAVPRALLPAAHGRLPQAAADRAGEGVQAYAPARVASTRIAARAGAWLSTRVGLLQQHAVPLIRRGAGAANGAGIAEVQASWRASETPVHVRQPRPALLARNDRPRASSHEGGHVSVGRAQTCLVHGPRAARAGGDLQPVGLNRAPRSLWATRLALASPVRSVIGPDWDGAITLRVEALLGTVDPARAPRWRIAASALVCNGVRYSGKGPEEIEHAPDEMLRFEAFSSSDTLAAGALKALPPASEVTLTLDLVWNADPGVVLNRQVRLHLWTAGPAGLSGLEVPLFFRFDDPEFNDRLGGLARLSRLPSPVQAGDDVVLAADLSQLRADERVELVLALRPQVQGEAVQLPFIAGIDPGGGRHWRYGAGPDDRQLRLVVERRRKIDGVDSSLRLVGERAIVNASWLESWSKLWPAQWNDRSFLLVAAGPLGETLFHALSIDLTALRLAAPLPGGLPVGDEPLLQSGDQLALFIVRGWTSGAQAGETLVAITLDVVEQPSLPANPSAFAVLAAQIGDAANSEVTRVNTHLYATSPDATLIEIVDPRDLIEGLVRRRAVYQWRSFLARDQLDHVRFALQKVNAVGGSWLPSALDEAWMRPSA